MTWRKFWIKVGRLRDYHLHFYFRDGARRCFDMNDGHKFGVSEEGLTMDGVLFRHETLEYVEIFQRYQILWRWSFYAVDQLVPEA